MNISKEKTPEHNEPERFGMGCGMGVLAGCLLLYVISPPWVSVAWREYAPRSWSKYQSAVLGTIYYPLYIPFDNSETVRDFYQWNYDCAEKVFQRATP